MNGYGALIGFSVNKEETLEEPISGESSKIILDHLPRTIAGSSLNVIRTMNSLGSDAKLLCTVGKDSHSGDVLDALKNWGIDFFPLPVRRETPRTIVVIPPSLPKKTKLYCYKPPYDKYLIKQSLDKITEQVALCCPKYLVATGVRRDDLPLVRALFDGTGIKVLNPSYELMGEFEHIAVWSNDVDIPKPDLLVINHEEACAVLGKHLSEFDPENDIGQLYNKLMVNQILVTHNSKGSYYLNESERPGHIFYTPAIETEVVDPTGAGDAFLGGYLHARIKKLLIVNALVVASAVAAAKIKKIGGSNVPTLYEVKELLGPNGFSNKI